MEDGWEILSYIVFYTKQVGKQFLAINFFIDDIDICLIYKILLQSGYIGMVQLHHCVNLIKC